MQPEMVWNGILTAALGVICWAIKSHADEQKRLQVLLNRTREEIARDYVTKGDAHSDIDRLISRMEAMEAKLDRLIERLVK